VLDQILPSLPSPSFTQADAFFATKPRNTFWKAIEKVLEGFVKTGENMNDYLKTIQINTPPRIQSISHAQIEKRIEKQTKK
jgi:G:T/U-mismatch repair DNA glycosylase